MTTDKQLDAHLLKYPPFAHLSALVWIAIIGGALAFTFAIWSGTVLENALLSLSLGLLQNAAMLVAALAIVGAIVLGGVRALHAHPDLSTKSRP